MSGDADDFDLTMREVNDVLLASGLDPAAVREFAWDLVQQEFEVGLPTTAVEREIELGRRLRKLINRFDDGKGPTRVTLTGILQGIITELDSRRHKAKSKGKEKV